MTKIISDPVSIEFFTGPRSYHIPVRLSRILPSDKNTIFAAEGLLELEKDNHYIEFKARTKQKEPFYARKECEDEIDKIITMLSMIYKSDIFDKVIYDGWLSEKNKFMVETCFKVTDPVSINEDNLLNILREIKRKHNKDIDINNRFKLMSRFYSKALQTDPLTEEKLIWLWTILEIFPMKNTTNIKPISDYLAEIIGGEAAIIKEKLNIGRLYALRCDLVHDGKLINDELNINDMFKNCGPLFDKLENIVFEILRGMCGLEYSGSLEKYF